ncbi:Hypothetical predicted protein [Olea europaea subsp. europaea]|uniref:Uncharacterized protein n=1 Tax=Olea europaea subsp. europaea TaxID=158383 RepID=A0A8S0USP3_OLEEU|nr:Hypothetical predicted protein [Olea europaea subsp. europaea]
MCLPAPPTARASAISVHAPPEWSGGSETMEEIFNRIQQQQPEGSEPWHTPFLISGGRIRTSNSVKLIMTLAMTTVGGAGRSD